MTRTAATNPVFLTRPRVGRAPATRRPGRLVLAGWRGARARWGGLAEVLVGLVLLALWALLWSVLVAGVIGPAGRVAQAQRAAAARAAVAR